MLPAWSKGGGATGFDLTGAVGEPGILTRGLLDPGRHIAPTQTRGGDVHGPQRRGLVQQHHDLAE